MREESRGMLSKNNKPAYWIALVLLLCFQSFAEAQVTAATDDATELLNRYKKFLFATDTSRQSFNSIPPINNDGRWTDIDYKDDNPSGWQLSIHMRRIRALALYLSRSE